MESLESRLAPAGIVNGDFAITDPADPNYGWTTRGGAAIANGQGVLNESPTVQAEFSQSFTIPAGTTALRFVIVGANLIPNGPGNPPDAFEAALLDAKTSLPLVGPPTGLANTDSFLNIQQTGEVFYAPQVAVPGAGASGAMATLSYPELITVDLSQLAAGSQATLFFDLVGIAPASSTVRITDVTLLSGATPPPVSFVLDPATDSGLVGDNLTNFDPVNLVGTTDPNQAVSLDTTGGDFTDGTTTADATGHFTFPAVALAEGANPVRVRATNAQGSSIATRTITVDTQRPTGTLVSPAPGSTTSTDQGYVDVQWTDPGAAGIDPASYGTGDVTITGVTVDQVQDLGNNLERYRYNLDGETLKAGTVNVVLVGGQVTDRAANTNVQTTQSFVFQLAPTATPQSVTTAQETALPVTLTGTDFNLPPLPLVFSVTTGPTHGHLSGTAPALTYTPDAGYFGPDSLQFKVNNGLLDSPMATVSIAVIGRPIATPQILSGPQDVPIAIGLTATDPNNPARPLTFSITTSPVHGTLSGVAPQVTYTPDPGTFGPDTFAFTASNGVATSAPAFVTITIVGRPTANPQSISTTQSTPAAIVLTAGDPNTPALPLSFTVTAGPQHGTLAGTAPNLTYTPATNYVGPDSFQFTAGNGAATSSPASISLTVTAASHPVPTVARDDAYTTAENHVLNVAAPGVLANDSASGPASLMAALVSGPAHGTLQYLNSDGSFTYIPNPSFSGEDQFVYRVISGSSQGNSAIVRLAVTPGSHPANLLPDTPHFRYIRNRRAVDPARFDSYHPVLGAILRLEAAGVPTAPTRLVPANHHFNVDPLRRAHAQDPATFDLRQPVLGALFQLESGGPVPSRLVPGTTHLDALRARFAADPQKFQRQSPYFGAIFVLEVNSSV